MDIITDKLARSWFNRLHEAVGILREQDPMAQPQPPAAPPATPAPTPPVADPNAAPPPATDSSSGQQPEVTVDMLVDKLNIIRGGKSFTDPEVYGKLTTEWKNLEAGEKATMDKVLGMIGDIVKNQPQDGNANAAPQNTPTAQQSGGTPPPGATQGGQGGQQTGGMAPPASQGSPAPVAAV